MLIVLKADVTPEQQQAVEDRVRSLGFAAHPIPGATRTAFAIVRTMWENFGLTAPDVSTFTP